jgi:hypothetical protein
MKGLPGKHVREIEEHPESLLNISKNRKVSKY